MRFYVEFLVQPNEKEKRHFGFFFSFFRSEPKDTSNFNAKNEIKRNTNNSKKNDKNFPKN